MRKQREVLKYIILFVVIAIIIIIAHLIVGGGLLKIVELPEDNDMRERGMTEKCIYRFEL